MLIWITRISSYLWLAYHKSDHDESNCIPTKQRESSCSDERQEVKWECLLACGCLAKGIMLPGERSRVGTWTSYNNNILLITYRRFQRCILRGIPTEGICAFHSVRMQHVPNHVPQDVQGLCSCLPTFHQEQAGRNSLMVSHTSQKSMLHVSKM